MKHLLHVFHYGKLKFDFRLTILGFRFRSLETWHHPRDAAFWADCLKFYVREKFKVPGSPTTPTLAPDVFTEYADNVGVNLADLSQLLTALPSSCQTFLSEANEALSDFAATQTKEVQELAAFKDFKKAEKKRRNQAEMRAFIEKTQAEILKEKISNGPLTTDA